MQAIENNFVNYSNSNLEKGMLFWQHFYQGLFLLSPLCLTIVGAPSLLNYLNVRA